MLLPVHVLVQLFPNYFEPKICGYFYAPLGKTSLILITTTFPVLHLNYWKTSFEMSLKPDSVWISVAVRPFGWTPARRCFRSSRGNTVLERILLEYYGAHILSRRILLQLYRRCNAGSTWKLEVDLPNLPAKYQRRGTFLVVISKCIQNSDV